MNSTLFGAASSTPISSTSAKAMEALNKFTTFTNTADKIKAPTFKFSGVKQLIANGELKDADSEEISDGIKVTNSQTACGPAHNAVSGTERRTETLFDFKAGKVNLVSPWRDVQWTEERRTSLMEAICSYSPSSGEVTHARVLLLGPTRSGKSSFISSVQSVFNGRVTNRAMVGSSSTSFTKKLQSFTILGQKSEGPTRLVLCDAMGLGDGEMTGLTLHDILSVIKGHVPEGHKFRPEEVVRSETENYVKWPSLKDKIHCVAFVLDASTMLAYSKGLRATFQQLREHISDLGIHQVALLTHVDEICPQTAKDVSEVYKSLSIRETMRNAAQLLGMSTSYIVPVKNYSSELDLDMNTDVLLLSAVDHILQYVDLYFQDNTPQGTGSEME